MFNSTEKAGAFEDEAEAHFSTLITALTEEERLLRELRESLDNSKKDLPRPEPDPELVRAIEKSRRKSGEALEQWRVAVKRELQR